MHGEGAGCACGVGVCGVGEEPHAEGVLGGGAKDSKGRRSSRVGAAVCGVRSKARQLAPLFSFTPAASSMRLQVW